MILPYTKIIGLGIYELKNQSKVGIVKEIVFQKTDYKISGIILDGSFFGRSIKVVSEADIVEISPKGIIVKDVDSVSDLKENARIQNEVKAGLSGIGQKVVTKSGSYLGRVYDLFISTDTLATPKLFVKSVFSERVISSNAIVEIKKRKIIVRDEFQTVKVSVPEISTSII